MLLMKISRRKLAFVSSWWPERLLQTFHSFYLDVTGAFVFSCLEISGIISKNNLKSLSTGLISSSMMYFKTLQSH